MCGWCSSSWMILFPNLPICLPLPLLFNWNAWLQTMRMKINKLWLRWVCSHCPSPPSCNLLFLFLIFLFFLLLNELYYIYSCTTIITPKFHSISIPNPQQISPPPRSILFNILLFGVFSGIFLLLISCLFHIWFLCLNLLKFYVPGYGIPCWMFCKASWRECMFCWHWVAFLSINASIILLVGVLLRYCISLPTFCLVFLLVAERRWSPEV